MRNLHTRPMVGTLIALASGLIAFLLTEILFVLFIGSPWRPNGELLVADSLVVALPLSLPLLVGGTGVGFALRRRAAWALLPAVVAAPCVVGAVALELDWLMEAAAHVSEAAAQAYRDNGFAIVSWMWHTFSGLVLVVISPVLFIALILDILLLPLVILFSKVFLIQLAAFALRCGVLVAAGVAVTAAICVPLIRWVDRRDPPT